MSATTSRPVQPGGRHDDVLAALKGAADARTLAEIADQLRMHPSTARFRSLQMRELICTQ